MKNYKDYLKEFREVPPPQQPSGDDPIREIHRFMEKHPFRLNTRGGDLLHFDSAYDAAKSLFRHLEQHEEGHNHSVQQEIPHMIRYFQKSTRTHERALDLLQDYITNHPRLPEDLRLKVEPALHAIQSDILDEHAQKKDALRGKKDVFGRPADDIGRRVRDNYGAMPITIQGEEYHPHQDDEMHHLEGVAGDLEDNMDESGAPTGFIRRREERNDL